MKSLPLAFLVILCVAFGVCAKVDAQCEPTVDCNGNGSADSCDIAENNSDDCDGDGVPDECQITQDPSLDCNQDSVLDACEGNLENILNPVLNTAEFGSSAEMSGDWLAIGAPEAQYTGSDSGAVHLYRNIGSRWVEEATLVAPDPDDGAEFGHSVSIHDDLLIVGAPGLDGGSSGQVGAAYIFRNDGSSWNFEQKLMASNGTSNDEFGISVGISDERAVIGAWAALSGSDSGAAYIFSFDGNTWTEDQVIQANDPSAAKHFGGAVAIDGDFIAVGDEEADLGFMDSVGAVYLYTSVTSSTWIFTQKLTAQDPQSGAEFGSSVDLDGENMLVGAPLADSANGAAYHYERTSFVYTQAGKLSSAQDDGQLGIDVAITDDYLVIGAWKSNDNAGGITIFEKNASGGYDSESWTPSNLSNGTRFGSTVAAAGRWCCGASLTSEFAVADRRISLPDCDLNGVDDPCDIFLGDAQDCNLDGVPDSCQIASGAVSDCNNDAIPDQCQLDDGSEPDCNTNGVIDSCDIASGTSPDCNANAIPDDCENDCNFNGVEDSCEIADGIAFDCNANGILDQCDIAFGFASDCNANAIPDSCDIVTGVANDCNSDTVLDVCEILLGVADDCNSNGYIDLCELAEGTSQDCNLNSVPDICDIAFGVSPDCNSNLNPDECELSSGSQPDCNSNGVIDSCDIASGFSGDCDTNLNPDECDVALGAIDCDGNLVPDICEVDTDLVPPTIVGLPVSIEISATAGTCETPVTWDPPTIADDCGVDSTVTSHESGDMFQLGTTEVSYVVTDVSGNVTGQTFNVIVVDDQMPGIVGGPVDIQIDNIPGECQAVVSWDEPTASDNCAIGSFEPTIASGSSFPVGTTTVTYIAVDSSDNTTTHSFLVVVDDVDLPSIQGLPGTVIVNTNPDLCTALVSWAAPTIVDNCPGSTVTSDHNPGDAFPVGVTMVTYTATDAQGNQSQSSFEMTVIDDQEPLVSGIPTSLVLDNDPGICGAVYEWMAPEASDNCGNPAISISHTSGQLFEIGTTNVSVTVDDGNGNVLNFGFSVEVLDSEAPSIARMPEDITVMAEMGLCTTNVDWELPDASDNCEAATLVANHQPMTDYPVGTTEVTYTATDIYGNIALETFNITVVDDQAPGLSGLPADLSTNSLPGVCGATVAWADPNTEDNCGIASLETTNDSGSVFDVGVTAVTYTLTDVNGNVTKDSFLVTITDVENPVIADMPADVILDNEPGECGAIATWESPTASDNCTVSTLEPDHASGAFFPVGTTEVTYTATDDSGLQSTASFLVIINDQETPTITGLIGSVSFTNSEGACDGVATWDSPTAADNCGIESLTSSHESGWIFSVGETLVTYTAVDIHGNNSTATVTVTITDDESPTFVSAPADIALPNDAGDCSALVTWDTPEPADNCQVMSLGTTHLPGTVFTVGVTPVTYSAMDIYGNVATHTFIVTVIDNELAEILDVPATIALDAEEGLCTAVATWDPPSAADNCGILNFESTHTSGDVFPVGMTTVTLTATDSYFNVTTSTFDIEVTDAQAPSIVGMPDDIQLGSEPGLCSALASWTPPTGEDNCGIQSLVSSHDPDTYFNVGTTEVTITLTDLHGNVTEDVMLVTVTDIENPLIINLPERVTIPTEPGICQGTTSWEDPDTSDNCAVDLLEVSVESGSMLPVGDTDVVYTVTDIHGNSTSQSFIVTVEDQESPQFSSVPENILQSNDLDECGGAVTWADPEATDNCEVLSLTSSHASGDFFAVGTTEVTLTVTDVHENVQTTSFLVTVEDDQDPVILDIPLDVTSTAETGLCGASITWIEPTATDNCIEVTLDSSHQPGDFFPVGSSDVIYTAMDSHGNVIADKFKVTITDDEAPALVGMPSDMTITAEAGLCSATVSWEEVTSTDNCEIESLGSDHHSGDSYPVGDTLVTYTTSDIHGNVTSEDFLITITDDEAPEFLNIPERVTVSSEPGLCSASVSWDEPVASDNCEIDSIELTHNSGSQFPVGETTVSLTATDIHNNSTTVDFTVDVIDQEAPQILNTPADITSGTDAGECGASLTWDAPSATDNCEIDTFETSHTSGDFFDVGNTAVMLTATDIHGNTTTVAFVVIVEDTEDPEIAGLPAGLSYNTEPGICTATATWTDPAITDNCGIDSSSSTHLPGEDFPVGTTEVTYSTVDIHGNTMEASFLVTVVDEEDPQIIDLPDRITIPTEPGLCEGIAGWTDPLTSDNCQVESLQSDVASGTALPVGETVVTYTATDVHGNTHSESFIVTVEDQEFPEILGTPANIEQHNDAGACGSIVEWSEPTTTDNCGVETTVISHSSGEFFEVGLTEVTVTTTDIHGNSASASFTITINDTEDPVISGLPGGLSYASETGFCSATASWSDPVVSDNCDVDSLTATHLPGDTFEVGSTEVIYTATDIHGNEISASFLVLVVDEEYPVILDVPSDITVSNDPGVCGATVSWQQATPTDNCEVVVFEETHLPGTYFPVGTTPVTFAATDAEGNRTLASFDVTVIDNEDPELLGVPGNIEVSNDSGQCGAVVNWTAVSAQDNCDTVDLQSSHSPGDEFPIGTTSVSVTATDQYGNKTAGSFTVDVQDSELPLLGDVPADITVSNDPGQCNALVDWAAPSASDNCPGETLTVTPGSGSSFAVGTTEVRVTVTDAAGNAVTDTFSVTVEDLEDPTIVSTGDITVEATPETCNSEIQISEPTAMDNCEVLSVVNDYTDSSDASGTYELGTTLITWTVTDTHGNTATTTQLITVIVDETDCNENGAPDICEIASGASEDCNTNGIPDECEADCNGNGTPDDCDIASGGSADTNSNGTPDECETPFQRGDANDTGDVDLTDPIYILEYVVGIGPVVSCLDTADVNNDESLDISDVVYLLQHMFLATAPPAAPFGFCGLDPDGISIGCDSYSNCP
ncbi:MAG: HYR domain-containing protein [Planctomycetota bacterium]|nr:HYR domain-containing protein [Planctomycetota bacterium]